MLNEKGQNSVLMTILGAVGVLAIIALLVILVMAAAAADRQHRIDHAAERVSQAIGYCRGNPRPVYQTLEGKRQTVRNNWTAHVMQEAPYEGVSLTLYFPDVSADLEKVCAGVNGLENGMVEKASDDVKINFYNQANAVTVEIDRLLEKQDEPYNLAKRGLDKTKAAERAYKQGREQVDNNDRNAIDQSKAVDEIGLAWSDLSSAWLYLRQGNWNSAYESAKDSISHSNSAFDNASTPEPTKVPPTAIPVPTEEDSGDEPDISIPDSGGNSEPTEPEQDGPSTQATVGPTQDDEGPGLQATAAPISPDDEEGPALQNEE